MIISDANLLHVHLDRRRRGNIERRLWRLMKRRSAIEPMIGHVKREHCVERNRREGMLGERFKAILSVSSHELYEAHRIVISPPDSRMPLFGFRVAFGSASLAAYGSRVSPPIDPNRCLPPTEFQVRPPHSPTPIPAVTISNAAGANAVC
jgi:hypothetical protein